MRQREECLRMGCSVSKHDACHVFALHAHLRADVCGAVCARVFACVRTHPWVHACMSMRA